MPDSTVPDLALLCLPDGRSLRADLSVLLSRATAEGRAELVAGAASRRTAAVLWSRTYDSAEQRAFFAEAMLARGFAVQRLDPVADALRWLSEHGAVVRWHDRAGHPAVRASVAAADGTVVVVQRAVDGDPAAALPAVVDALAAEVRSRAARRHLTVVR